MADTVDPAAMKIQASFVNQFQIVMAGNNVRISFAEGFQGQPSNYRSAVVMSAQDAFLLASSLLNATMPQQQTALSGLGLPDNALFNAGQPLNALAAAAAHRYAPKDPDKR